MNIFVFSLLLLLSGSAIDVLCPGVANAANNKNLSQTQHLSIRSFAGESGSALLTLVNQGQETALYSVTIEDQGSPFKLKKPEKNQLIPSQSHTLEITYSPSCFGNDNSALIINRDNHLQRVSLSGKSLIRVPQAAPLDEEASPVTRNHLINQSYHAIDLAMNLYLCNAPGNNWFTFAKHVSRFAGKGIKFFSTFFTSDPRHYPLNTGMLFSMLPNSSWFNTEAFRHLDPKDMSYRERLSLLIKTWGAGIPKLRRMYKSLADINYQIYSDIGGSTLLFFEFENSRLFIPHNPGHATYPGDTAGFLKKGFETFRGVRLATPGVRERETLLMDANYLLATQEQLTIAEPLFDTDFDIWKSLSGFLVLIDPTGEVFHLRENWGQLL